MRIKIWLDPEEYEREAEDITSFKYHESQKLLELQHKDGSEEYVNMSYIQSFRVWK